MTTKILVVEDTTDVRITLKGILEDRRYFVRAVANESEAIVEISSERFDFALIDVRLHDGGEEDQSGLSLAMAIHTLKPDMRIIMLSRYICSSHIVRAVRYHGAIDFIDKSTPDWVSRVLQAISEAQQTEAEPRRFKGLANKLSQFSYSLVPQRSAVIRARGSHVCTVFTADPVELDLHDYKNLEQIARNEQDLERRRYHVGSISRKLWNDLFHDHFDVEKAYVKAHDKAQLLSLQFEIPRDLSSLPLEFIREDGSNEYLILQHPFSRLLIGVSPKREAISPNLLALSNQLRVLLIASNTIPTIDGVDDEIRQLQAFFETQDFFPVKADILSTEVATKEHIREILKNPDYDIVHFAGHGHYNIDSPEESCLFFWEGNNKTGNIVTMTAAELKLLLDQSSVRFVYLSCCYGTTAGDSGSLVNDDFVGLADAVVQAGVPSVLGYRWRVSDLGARQLAVAFYHSLLEQGSIEIALWQARCELAVDRNNPTWLSPILIHQV